jgi:hypothetical protein
MRVALAVLCIGAVAFLLRVLMAVLKELTRLPSRAMRVHFAKFNPPRRRGQVVEMSLEDKRPPERRGARKAV